MDIEEIVDSWMNGQFKQWLSQVKTYGIADFFIDLWNEYNDPALYIEMTKYYFNSKLSDNSEGSNIRDMETGLDTNSCEYQERRFGA